MYLPICRHLTVLTTQLRTPLIVRHVTARFTQRLDVLLGVHVNGSRTGSGGGITGVPPADAAWTAGEGRRGRGGRRGGRSREEQQDDDRPDRSSDHTSSSVPRRCSVTPHCAQHTLWPEHDIQNLEDRARRPLSATLAGRGRQRARAPEAGDDAVVRARAVQVRPPDRGGLEARPEDVGGVDRHALRSVEAGDEALVPARPLRQRHGRRLRTAIGADRWRSVSGAASKRRAQQEDRSGGRGDVRAAVPSGCSIVTRTSRERAPLPEVQRAEARTTRVSRRLHRLGVSCQSSMPGSASRGSGRP